MLVRFGCILPICCACGRLICSVKSKTWVEICVDPLFKNSIKTEENICTSVSTRTQSRMGRHSFLCPTCSSATWLNQLQPAYGEKQLFFEEELHRYTKKLSTKRSQQFRIKTNEYRKGTIVVDK